MLLVTRCNQADWNGQYWVAVGSGNSIAYSIDGKVWTPLGNTIFWRKRNMLGWNKW